MLLLASFPGCGGSTFPTYAFPPQAQPPAPLNSVVSVVACTDLGWLSLSPDCHSGTAWAAGAGRYVTDAHVLVDATPKHRPLPHLFLVGWDGKSHPVRVLAADLTDDAALVQSNGFATPLTLASTDPLPAGTPVVVLCSYLDALDGPRGPRPVSRDDAVAITGRTGAGSFPNPPVQMELQRMVAGHGCSGGPVLADGGVVAMVEGELSDGRLGTVPLYAVQLPLEDAAPG